MNSDNFPFTPNQTARKKLAEKLNLDFNDSMQDWEYEVADANRIQDFIAEYDKIQTSDSEKESLMEIIIDSANDLLLNKRNKEFKISILLINERLRKNEHLHFMTINYWKKNEFEISDKLI